MTYPSQRPRKMLKALFTLHPIEITEAGNNMTTSGTILPDNSTPLERALDTTAEKRLALDTPKPMDVESLPVHLLAHLALTLSVDVWEEDWSETSKRTMCLSKLFKPTWTKAQ